MKIAVIARCKNEIQNLREWLINKNFSNLIFITDNESTDGSFEFLKKQENVIVTPVKGFDEGRDFQILLSKARDHKVDWVFKFDCDEFVGEDFETQLNYVLNQTDYDCIRMRKVSKHYKAPKDKCVLSREYYYGGVYGVRLSSKVDITNRRIHVGSFYFYKKSLIIESLVTHYWVRSEKDAIERARIYSEVDKRKNYEIRDKISIENFVDIEDAKKSQEFKKFYEYGSPFLIDKGSRFEIVKPKLNKQLIKYFAKKTIWFMLRWCGLTRIYLKWNRLR